MTQVEQVLVEPSRHDKLLKVEQQILEKQQVIEACMSQLNSLRDKAEELISQAAKAQDERDLLLLQVEEQGLWADDFESADDYFDHIGLSRQRTQQIRDRITVTRIVNSVDAALPPVSDLAARKLRQLLTPEAIVEVYRVAVTSSHGNPPSPRRVELLVNARQEGIDIKDGEAVAIYEEQCLVYQALAIFDRLSTVGKMQIYTEVMRYVNS